MRYHEDPTSIGEARTAEHLRIVQVDMLRNAVGYASAQLVLLIAAVVFVGLIAGMEGIVPAFIACVPLGAVMVIRAFLQYRNEKAMSDETLGVVKSDLFDTTEAPELIRSLCRVTDVPEPTAIGYAGSRYTGEYDPNLDLVALGLPLRYYETDAALMTAAHEAAHHILLFNPKTRYRESCLLRCASLCDTIGVAFAVLFIVLLLMEPYALQDAMGCFAGFLVVQLLKRGIVTTHENRANTTLWDLYLEHPDLFEGVSDMESAFKTLRLGIHTYYADLAMWVVISAIFVVARAFAG